MENFNVNFCLPSLIWDEINANLGKSTCFWMKLTQRNHFCIHFHYRETGFEKYIFEIVILFPDKKVIKMLQKCYNVLQLNELQSIKKIRNKYIKSFKEREAWISQIGGDKLKWVLVMRKKEDFSLFWNCCSYDHWSLILFHTLILVNSSSTPITSY